MNSVQGPATSRTDTTKSNNEVFSIFRERPHSSRSHSTRSLSSTSTDVGFGSSQDFHNYAWSTSSNSMSVLGSSSGTGSHESESTPSPTPFPRSRPKKTKLCSNQRITNYVDKISSKEIDDITDAIGEFFFACNIPFNAVTSQYFEKMVKSLRPSYVQHIPGRKKLATTVLDSCYNRCMMSKKRPKEEPSVILIDGWKNTSSNTRTVVAMLHTADGRKTFLEAWDINSTFETGQKLKDIVEESVQIAHEKYNMNVYAVVSDNASNMRLMGNLISLWHIGCKSHIGNLLAKDILDNELKKKVMTIIHEFKQADCEALILKAGGKKMISPGDTRWCSHRDAYRRVLENIPHMKKIMIDDTVSHKKVKTAVKKLIIDEEFLQALEDQVHLLDPVCEVINECQRENCSIADGAHFWLNLSFPAKYDKDEELQTILKKRKAMALDVYSLAAYFLHPKYHADASSKIADDLAIVMDFLIDQLDADGIESLSEFQQGLGVFEKLFQKDLRDPVAFWTVAAVKHRNLSELAIRLMKIPASSAQLERLFSQWQYVHCPIRNRLTFERSKKLAHIYYTLRFQDKIIDDDDDGDPIGIESGENVEAG